MNRIVRAAALVALAVWTAPAAAAAQGMDLDLRLTPRAGLMTPADWFYEEFKDFGTNPMQWTEAAIQSAPVVALTAEIRLPGSPLEGLWIRGEVLGTLNGETALTHAVYTPPSLAGPSFVARTRYVIPSTLLIGTLDVGIPTVFRLPYGVQPYLTLGIGGKRYWFEKDSLLDLAEDVVLPQDGTTLVYNVGGGAAFRIMGVEFDVLVRDAISTYWEQVQHDVMVLGGVSWRVF